MRQRRRGRWALALLAALFLALLLVELALRQWPAQRPLLLAGRLSLPANREHVLRLQPHYAFAEQVRVVKNAQGFRGPPAEAAPGGALRIIVVGSAQAENYYLTEGTTWSDRLAERLARSLSPLWLNNAGLDGQSTFGHLALLEDYVLALRPDVLVFLVGNKEVAETAPRSYDLMTRADHWDVSSFAAAARSVARNSQAVAALLRLKNQLAMRWRAPLPDPGFFGANPVGRPMPEGALVSAAEAERSVAAATEPYLAGFEARLRRIVELCRRHGILPVLLTQPALFGPAIDPWTGWDLARLATFWPVAGREAWRILESYNAVTRRVGRESDVLVVDLARTMPKSVRYFYDPVNFTTEGAAHLAELLSVPLCPYLASRFPARQHAPCADQR
ncbi:MAG: hypothetical protein FJX68_18390 [Alphaproteobacteria bacterium]|nr:hypothetical protein [Alphaproteobacteria bacterium]